MAFYLGLRFTNQASLFDFLGALFILLDELEGKLLGILWTSCLNADRQRPLRRTGDFHAMLFP